jgi:hypothetical protein
MSIAIKANFLHKEKKILINQLIAIIKISKKYVKTVKNKQI